MYERMLDKDHMPSLNECFENLGEIAIDFFKKLEAFLKNSYNLSAELRFPFGNEYGWGMKYSHKSKHLCYVFFEKGAFTVTIQIGKSELSKLNEKLNNFLPKTRELWEKRYPCGDGGWIHYRVLNDEELNDVKELICIKKEPIKK